MSTPTTTVTLRLMLDGQPVELDIRVPTDPVRPVEMMRVFQSLADVFVSAAIRAVEACGRSLSCRDRCGACCRQAVSITHTDARRVRELVEALPQPRRGEILARFAAARRRIEEAGLLEDLRGRPATTAAGLSLARRYFDLQVACPFLEDESCSIYSDRPIACREYLVCSPPENCRNPVPGDADGGGIEGIQVPARVSHGVAALGHSAAPLRPWVPFILALEWAEQNPDASLPRPGPELLQELFQHLAAQSKPGK